jgi:HAD superfamily hydrolase (TIGR01549 family)
MLLEDTSFREPGGDSGEAIEGHLVCGFGRAGDLTQIDWVRRQLIDLVGIDPHPGTVNLEVRNEASRTRLQSWRSLDGYCIEPEEKGFCHMRCYPVRIAGEVPGAVVLPQIADYPEDKVELVAALPIRRHLSLCENARVRIDLCRPLGAKAVLFDIDGTLVDSVGAYVEVARRAAGSFGFEVTEAHVRWALATGSSFWKGVLPPGRRDGDAVEKALSMHAAREWPRVLQEHGRVFEGTGEVLEWLAGLGIRLGIVSGARPDVLELLRAEGILDRFDAVILGSDVDTRKPDPEGIFKCLSQLKVAPDAAVYVGDTPVDVQASRAAGVHAVGVLTGAGDSASLSVDGPDRLISSLAKLAAIVEPM